jgi:UDP-N-acetylglucosamine--N-acetylmuramyl-(pentapeptide) pyrophosphoryl-undecaprenol N-acetylglucosamine transferase
VLNKYQKAITKAKEIIKEFNPDIVIGAGGYITAPVLYAAHKLNYKTIIHEQNSIPGLSNKLISKYADKICVSLPGTIDYFPKDKVVYTGNPRSEEICKIKKANKKDYNLLVNKKLVVIVMGSLGSTTMTEKIKNMINNFKNKDYQVLIVTGSNYYESYKNIELPSNVFITPFVEDFTSLEKSTDLIISRAGASTIAEITAIGLPSILVPSPYVTNNHQYKNAKELEDAGACRIVSEEDFSKDKIIREIDKMFDDMDGYQKMVENSRKLGISDSSTRIYEEAKKIIR